MIYRPDDYIKMINNEIKWCEENKGKTENEETKCYELGFIQGLNQAKYLIEQTKILR